ncbi:hypothetical protein DIPPA_00983 [Diplonema papillatum]|nr:hypothetical protein DIPPA_00983 [Diplonema papillatum]
MHRVGSWDASSGIRHVSPGRNTSGQLDASIGSAGEGRLVTKLLDKLKESQQLFDNLETLFDHKARELGPVESDILRHTMHVPTSFEYPVAHVITDTARHVPSPIPSAYTAGPAANASAEIHLLHERLKQMQQDHTNHLKQAGEAAEAAFKARLQQEVMSRMSAHNQTVNELKDESVRQREDAHRRVMELQSELDSLREAALNMEQEHRRELDRTERDVSDSARLRLNEEVQARDAQLAAYRMEVDRMRLEVEERNLEISRKERSLDVANDAIRDLKDQHTEAGHALDVLNTKHQTLATEAARVAKAHEHLRDSKTALEHENGSLQASFDQQSAVLRQAREDADRKKDALAAAQDELSTLRKQFVDVTASADSRASELSRAKIETASLESKLQESTTRFERQIKQLERELTAKHDTQRTELVNELKTASSSLAYEKNRGEALRAQLEQHEQTVVSHSAQTQRVAELEMRLREKERELGVLADKTAEMDDLLAKLHARDVAVLSLEEAIRQLQVTVSDKDRDLVSTQQRLKAIDELRVQLSSADVRAASLEEREREAVSRLRQRDIELQAASDKIRKLDELKSGFREELATLRAQNDTLRDREEHGRARDRELLACREEMNRATAELAKRADEIKSLQGQVRSADALREDSTRLEEVKAQLVAKDNRVESLSQDLAKARLLCEQKDSEYEVLVQDYDEKEDECMKQAATLQAAEEELRDLARTRNQLQATRTKMQEMQAVFDKRELDRSEQAEALTSGCEQIAEGHQLLREECAGLQDKLGEALRRNDHLQALIQHKDFVADEKSREVDATNANMDELRAWLHDRVQELSDEAAQAREEREAAIKKVADVRSEVAAREQESAMLKRANDELRMAVEARSAGALNATAETGQGRAVRAERDRLADEVTKLRARLRAAEEAQPGQGRAGAEALRLEPSERVLKAKSQPSDQPDGGRTRAQREQLQASYDKLLADHSRLEDDIHRKEREYGRQLSQRTLGESRYEPQRSRGTESSLRKQVHDDRGEQPPSPLPAPAPHSLSMPAPDNSPMTPRGLQPGPLPSGFEQNVLEPSSRFDSTFQRVASVMIHEGSTQPAGSRLSSPVPEHLQEPHGYLGQSHVSMGAHSAVSEVVGVELTDDESKPVIGFRLDATTIHDGMPRVIDVKVGGPAYKAGMRKGDYLKHFDRQSVKNGDDVERILSKCEPGLSVEMSFVRVKTGGSATDFTTDVKLGSTGGSRMGSRKSSTGSLVHRSTSGPLRRSLVKPQSKTYQTLTSTASHKLHASTSSASSRRAVWQ